MKCGRPDEGGTAGRSEGRGRGSVLMQRLNKEENRGN